MTRAESPFQSLQKSSCSLFCTEPFAHTPSNSGWSKVAGANWAPAMCRAVRGAEEVTVLAFLFTNRDGERFASDWNQRGPQGDLFLWCRCRNDSRDESSAGKVADTLAVDLKAAGVASSWQASPELVQVLGDRELQGNWSLSNFDNLNEIMKKKTFHCFKTITIASNNTPFSSVYVF